MPVPTRALRVAVLVGAAALVLTACSDDGDDGATADVVYGPLDEYLSRISGYELDEDLDIDAEQARMDEENLRMEELTATCMAEQGFEYTPNKNSGGYVVSMDELDVDWDSREFAEQYGYQISLDPWEGIDTGPEEEEWTDANQDYVDSMSDSERDAYYEALYGAQTMAEPEGEDLEAEVETEWNWEEGGCQGAAQHEVWEGGGFDSDEFEALSDEVNSFYESLMESSELADLDARWASCMADAGYPDQTAPGESYEPLYEEWNELSGWEDPEYVALQESWDWEAKPEGPPEPERDEAAVEAFTAKEIAMAVADWDCKDEIDYQGEWSRIDVRAQQGFVDQHRDELEAWAAAAEAGRDS